MAKQEESNNMNSKIKILLLFMVLFVFGDCTSEVRYSSQIINYDYRNFDGVIYGSSQIFFLKNPLIYVISLVRVDIVNRSPHLS